VTDASGLGRPLVKEEVAAALEWAKLCLGNLAREDARVLERHDHVVGAVHDERGDGHRTPPLE